MPKKYSIGADLLHQRLFVSYFMLHRAKRLRKFEKETKQPHSDTPRSLPDNLSISSSVKIMLARYKIYRGKPPTGTQLPNGVRQDTRKHTRHCLRPTAESVAEYLGDPTAKAWKKFAATYLKTVRQRRKADPAPFDALAELAASQNVYLGCSCPTEKNPSVEQCHTVLALGFMQECYPELKVEFP